MNAVANKQRPMATERPGGLTRTFGIQEASLQASLENALIDSVSNSAMKPETGTEVKLINTSLAHTGTPEWLAQVFSHSPNAIDEFFDKEDMGNYVIDRQTGEKVWEKMPLYARIGMHLLFHGPLAIRFLTWFRIRRLLKQESIREGKIYDSTDPTLVLYQITRFINTYDIRLDELLEPDINKYPTFNFFFSRRLRSDARPCAFPDDPSIISSAADSRLTVFNSVGAAKKYWIKGREFTIYNLIRDRKVVASLGKQPHLAIWRLAPQDYHRFHSPVTGKFRSVTHIPGDYYTVNPQAINEDLNVFTANTRSVAVFDIAFSKDKRKTLPFVLVAVGALLVGSIRWDKNLEDEVVRGEPLGHFQYGGSTVIGVFPEAAGVKWDDDLAEASKTSLEVLVKAGERIGKAGWKV